MEGGIKNFDNKMAAPRSGSNTLTHPNRIFSELRIWFDRRSNRLGGNEFTALLLNLWAAWTGWTLRHSFSIHTKMSSDEESSQSGEEQQTPQKEEVVAQKPKEAAPAARTEVLTLDLLYIYIVSIINIFVIDELCFGCFLVDGVFSLLRCDSRPAKSAASLHSNSFKFFEIDILLGSAFCFGIMILGLFN